MLSILIPTYNYNIYELVKEVHIQAKNLNIEFEITVYDDSSKLFISENERVNDFSFTSYKRLSENLGRSGIRNLLAKNATYETLLFLDADVKITSPKFLSDYVKNINDQTEIIYGGIKYQVEKPSKTQLLRWYYGNSREALSVDERNKAPYLRFLTLNFLIKKSVFSKINFNESIPNLRHEDTLFSLDAKSARIHIKHIDNPVIHLGIENSLKFLEKSLESVEALKDLIDRNLIRSEETLLSNKGELYGSSFFKYPILFVYKIFKSTIEKNLLSASPSLFLFDFYRLGYYIKLKQDA